MRMVWQPVATSKCQSVTVTAVQCSDLAIKAKVIAAYSYSRYSYSSGYYATMQLPKVIVYRSGGSSCRSPH